MRTMPENDITPITPKTKTAISTYRTRKLAGDVNAIPNSMAILTNSKFVHAMTSVRDDRAYLMPIGKELVERLENNPDILSNGTWRATEEDYQKQELTNIDFPFLRVLYSIVLESVFQSIEKAKDTNELTDILQRIDKDYEIRLYVPDFYRALGLKENLNDDHIQSLINKMYSFNGLIGITMVPGRGIPSQHAVMHFNGYEAETNTIRFASPYMAYITKTVVVNSLQRDGKNIPQLTRSGKPKMLPSHSYALSTTLASERNKRAVEIVCVVDRLIEQAGPNGTPHITVKNLIHECPEMEYALERCNNAANRNRILRNAFSGAWKILRNPKYVKLQDKYQDLQIPDVIPTMGKLDLVLTFSHKGTVKPQKAT